MSAVFDRPSPWQRIKPVFSGFDLPLLIAMLLLGAAGLVTMYSAGFDAGTRFVDHGRNMLLALGVVFVVAQVSPQTLLKFAVPLYAVGVALLIAVAVLSLLNGMVVVVDRRVGGDRAHRARVRAAFAQCRREHDQLHAPARWRGRHLPGRHRARMAVAGACR